MEPRAPHHPSSSLAGDEEMPQQFYIDLRENPRLGRFITIYDEEILTGVEHFKDKDYTMVVDEEQLVELMRTAVSLIFYGRRCIEIGIREKYIHPEAVSKQNGVDVAIYIDVRI